MPQHFLVCTSLVSSVIKPNHSKVFILSRAKRRRSKQCCLEIVEWRWRDKGFPWWFSMVFQKSWCFIYPLQIFWRSRVYEVWEGRLFKVQGDETKILPARMFLEHYWDWFYIYIYIYVQLYTYVTCIYILNFGLGSVTHGHGVTWT